jgi:predicted TIM-barrel fold metal-dependent hydrolase
MSHEDSHRPNLKALLLFAALVMCPCAVLAQRGAGGIGGGLAGGGGLSGGNGIASGLDTKDDLKSFHDVLALQASKPQVGEYRLMLKCTEAAGVQLQAFLEQAGKDDRAELGDSAKGLLAAIEQARTANAKFLEQLSDRQKSGLRETIKKLNKTDSELGQQVKTLDVLIAAAKPANLQVASSSENLKSILTGFYDQQLELGDEISIATGGNDGESTFSIAPAKTVVTFENQPIVVTTSGVVSKVSLPSVQNAFQVELRADLSDLQQNITEVLRRQLSKSDPCGEQIVIQTAALTPSTPMSTVVAQLHYERWACFGGRGNANEMAEGNGSMEVTLTPTIAEDGTLRVSPVISHVDAEGLVGDLLRSGALGETVRDTIAGSVLSALRQCLDYKTVLPAAAQGYVKLQQAKFEAVGAGELSLALDGSMQLPSDKVAAQIEAELVGVKSGANAAPLAPAQASPR